MSSDLDLHGLYVPLITPFTEDDRPALSEIERLAHDVVDAGAAGLVALGTTGENATLDSSERAAVIDVIADVARQRSVKLLIGAGNNNTRSSIEDVQRAGSVAGVSGLLVVVPYYTRPSEAGVVEHFKTLAAASNVPLVIYNIPYRTGRGLGSASLLELADTANIAGVKQAVGSVDIDTLRLSAEKPSNFHVLCGDDPYIFSLMCLGASGAIAASSHLRTSDFVELIDASLKGDVVVARAMANSVLPMCEALFTEPNPAVLKAALASQGRISTPNLRSPMTPASADALERALMTLAFN